ncbi:MAG: sugar transferase [Clostridium sp.]|nr:sugar transferase [Clostridium sp.]
MLKKWEQLPPELQLEEVRPYYKILQKKKCSLILKRIFDVIMSLIMIISLSPLFLILAVVIKLDSEGPVFFRQERVTQYGEKFYIFKFRTMVDNAEEIGSKVTVNNDSRITRVGLFIRRYRLDEIPQLLNVLIGDMSFVGTRPEVKKYVESYTPKMMATLLLPAGVTSLASIKYKDEAKLLSKVNNVDETYVYKILPGKMQYNLQSIERFSFWNDIKLMFMTLEAVIE